MPLRSSRNRDAGDEKCSPHRDAEPGPSMPARTGSMRPVIKAARQIAAVFGKLPARLRARNRPAEFEKYARAPAWPARGEVQLPRRRPSPCCRQRRWPVCGRRLFQCRAAFRDRRQPASRHRRFDLGTAPRLRAVAIPAWRRLQVAQTRYRASSEARGTVFSRIHAAGGQIPRSEVPPRRARLIVPRNRSAGSVAPCMAVERCQGTTNRTEHHVPRPRRTERSTWPRRLQRLGHSCWAVPVIQHLAQGHGTLRCLLTTSGGWAGQGPSKADKLASAYRDPT